MCISVDLPEPGRSHDRGEGAGGERDVDAAQGIDGGVALAVALGQLVAADDGLGREGIVCGGGESHVTRISPHARAHIRRLHPNRVGVSTACGAAAGST